MGLSLTYFYAKLVLTQKILWHFIVDVTATKTSKLLNINRNTINRYYNIFRKIIYCYQIVNREI